MAGEPALAPTMATNAAGLAAACCDRWADGSGRPAILNLCDGGLVERVGFDGLRAVSTRFAQVLLARGIGAGDRIAVLLPQGPEALVAVLAADRLGAVAVLPPTGAGVQTLAEVLRATRCVAAVLDEASLDLLPPARFGLPGLDHLFCTDGARDGAACFWTEADRAHDLPPPSPGGPGMASLLFHAADAMGRRRSILHARRSVLAQADAFLAQYGKAGPGELFWTAADWTGPGGLLDAMLPALALGRPVLTMASRGFDPVRATNILSRLPVRDALLPPAALRAMRDAGTPPPAAGPLRSIGTFAGVLGPDMLAWAAGHFGVPLREALSHPECGVYAVSDPDAPLQLRRAPGRRVVALDPQGRPLPQAIAGILALRRPDPGLFIGYWGDDAATRAAFGSPWIPTGETGSVAPDGTIALLPPPAATSGAAGEALAACLRGHPAVAAALLVPDAAEDGLPPTAIVVPRPGTSPGPALAATLRGFLRDRFPARLCPRRVAFAQALPVHGVVHSAPGLIAATRGIGSGPAGG